MDRPSSRSMPFQHSLHGHMGSRTSAHGILNMINMRFLVLHLILSYYEIEIDFSILCCFSRPDLSPASTM